MSSWSALSFRAWWRLLKAVVISSQYTLECKRNVCGYHKSDGTSVMSVGNRFLYMWKLQLTVSRLVWSRRSNIHISVAYSEKEFVETDGADM